MFVASFSRYGEFQAAGTGSADVSEWFAGPRGGHAQPCNLSHSIAFAA